ncbi:13985_t:CDS:1, partial [Cetraspora pellucida]
FRGIKCYYGGGNCVIKGQIWDIAGNYCDTCEGCSENHHVQ